MKQDESRYERKMPGQATALLKIGNRITRNYLPGPQQPLSDNCYDERLYSITNYISTKLLTYLIKLI